MPFLAACAHISSVLPSLGHIDSQVQIQNQTPVKPNPNAASVYQKPLSQTLNTEQTALSAAYFPEPVNQVIDLPPPKTQVITKPLTLTKHLQKAPQIQAQKAPPKEAPKTPPNAALYSVVVFNTPVKEVLFALARDSNLNVDIHPSIQGNVTINAIDQPLIAILERLSKQVDLTYLQQNNVLIITPDQPVLRSYKIDYVNMYRDTRSFIGAAAEIATAGRGATINGAGSGGQAGVGGAGSAGGAAGGGGAAANSSRTSVSSESKNHLWESLIINIKELLSETDKEVIVSRFGSVNNAQTENPAETDAGVAKTMLDQQKSEFKTLFAAKVIANAETGVISVRATNKQHEKVEEFIRQVMHSAKKQVLIEATIVEVQLSDTFQAGIDWSRLNNSAANSGFQFNQTLGSSATFDNTGNLSGAGNNALSQATSAGFVAGYLNRVSRVGNIASSVTLLKQFGQTKVLSSPKLMVLNNQTAVLKVVDNLVYFTVEAQPSVVSGGGVVQSPVITTRPNTVPVGVVMSVTPQINDDGNVNVNVRPTISSVVDLVDDPNPAFFNPANGTRIVNSRVPVIQVREMESLLQIQSGNTAVLGGLMQDQVFKNSDKVPGLSDIPILGKIFSGRNDAVRKTELIIFLRPTVILNATLESEALASYKKYLPSAVMNDAEGPKVDK